MRVIPATGANALSVAEYVVATAMLLLRGAYAATPAVVAGKWPRGPLSNGREIGGKTLGLVGFGGIGQLTAKLARGLGMEVAAFDAMMDSDHPAFAATGVRCAGLDEVITMSDVVSLHVPLVDSTRGLFSAGRIASMKKGAVLVNTARGGIVDEVALAAALKSGHLGGAAIDVFDTEPLPASPHFEGCPNLVLTPHIAGVSAESNERVSFMIAREILEFLK
jgi:(S)-sulfolactate dehydrogenase